MNGGQDGTWDVFGHVVPWWKKGMTGISDNSTFFNRRELHIENCEVEGLSHG
ncbi:hypothetical protein ACWS5K_000799 [Acinetobacter baumannii]